LYFKILATVGVKKCIFFTGKYLDFYNRLVVRSPSSGNTISMPCNGGEKKVENGGEKKVEKGGEKKVEKGGTLMGALKRFTNCFS